MNEYYIQMAGICCEFFPDSKASSVCIENMGLSSAASFFVGSDKSCGNSGEIHYKCKLKIGQKEEFSSTKAHSFSLIERENIIQIKSFFDLSLSLNKEVSSLLCLNPLDLASSFDHGLRFLFGFFAAWNRGILVHAAALRTKNGHGLLFPGKSGQGKSTLVSLCKDMNIIGDDLIFIRKNVEGFEIWGNPFNKIQEKGLAGFPVPLKHILFIEHARGGASHAIASIDSYEAAALLVSLSPCAIMHQLTCEKICDFILGVVSSVRMARFYFAPDFSLEAFLYEYIEKNSC